MTSGGDSVSTSPSTERTIKPSLLGEPHRAGRRRPAAGSERTLAGLVGDKFDAADQAEPARFADQRMLAERLQPRLELRRAFGGFFENTLARVDLDRLHRDRRGNRMAAIGEAVAEHADLFALEQAAPDTSFSGIMTPAIGR